MCRSKKQIHHDRLQVECKVDELSWLSCILFNCVECDKVTLAGCTWFFFGPEEILSCQNCCFSQSSGPDVEGKLCFFHQNPWMELDKFKFLHGFFENHSIFQFAWQISWGRPSRWPGWWQPVLVRMPIADQYGCIAGTGTPACDTCSRINSYSQPISDLYQCNGCIEYRNIVDDDDGHHEGGGGAKQLKLWTFLEVNVSWSYRLIKHGWAHSLPNQLCRWYHGLSCMNSCWKML